MKNQIIFLLLAFIFQGSLGLTDDELIEAEYNLEASQHDSSQSNDAMVFKLNKGIDFMLTVARWVFTSHGELTLDLPNINRPFGHSVFSGTFNATGGWFRNIGSLHRTGDVAFVLANKSISLEVALGLSELQAGYKKYSLNILKINQSGNMTFNVDNNSVKMKMAFSYSPKCQFSLELLEFDKLDGIRASIDGLGNFQMLYNELSTWLISNFEERFRGIANEKIKEKLNGAINDKSDEICAHFPKV